MRCWKTSGLESNATNALLNPCLTACSCLIADILSAVDDVAKVDTSNAVQVQRLYSAFSHNMATVNFWLRFVVFPAETNQYPQRLVANSWHLAEGSRVVGFSGTNDNHRLLPLQVHQAQLEEPMLQATNGKMLHVILKHTKGCTTVQAGAGQVGFSCWAHVQELAACQAAACSC
jgi:hypothetical protein